MNEDPPFRPDDEAENDGEMSVEELLRVAEADVARVVQELASKDLITFESLSPPDPSIAESTKNVDNQEGLLLHFLSKEDRRRSSSSEVLGTVEKWWRVVERAFGIAGIFSNWLPLGSEVHVEQRYEAAVRPLKERGERVYGYRHAFSYNKLGRLLLRYPRLLYQLRLVSITEWLSKRNDGQTMMQALETHLNKDADTVWLRAPLLETSQPFPPLEHHTQGVYGPETGVFAGLSEVSLY